MFNNEIYRASGNLLITGGSGFIGANIYRFFLNWKIFGQIFIQVRDSSDLWRYRVLGFSPITLQNCIADTSFWDKFLIENNIVTVIHLAASGGFVSQNNTNEILETNLFSSIKFLNSCINSGVVEKFISTGSSAEYGVMNRIATEKDITYPNSEYGWSKLSFGYIGQKNSENSKMLFVHLRLYTIYGELEHPSRFVPRLITLGRDGFLPKLSNKKISKDYVYIRDFIDLIYKIILCDKKIVSPVNVSSGLSISHEELVEKIKTLFSVTTSPEWGAFPSRDFDNFIWSGSPALAKKIYNWAPKFDLTKGITSTTTTLEELKLFEYYKKNLNTLPT